MPTTCSFMGGVDDWRGVGRCFSTVCRPFRLAVSQSKHRESVSSRRSSNRTCGTASGSRTRSQAFVLGKSCAQRGECHETQRVVEVIVREPGRSRIAHLMLL